MSITSWGLQRWVVQELSRAGVADRLGEGSNRELVSPLDDTDASCSSTSLPTLFSIGRGAVRFDVCALHMKLKLQLPQACGLYATAGRPQAGDEVSYGGPEIPRPRSMHPTRPFVLNT